MYPFDDLKYPFVELLQKGSARPDYTSTHPSATLLLPCLTNGLPPAPKVIPVPANCLPAPPNHLPPAPFLFPSAANRLALGELVYRSYSLGHRNDTECFERKMSIIRLKMNFFERVGIY